MHPLIKYSLLLFTGMLLAACEQPVAPEPGPSINFTRFQPMYFDVAKIEMVDEYKSPMQPPNVEYLLPVSPAEAMHRWVKDRLRTVGMDRSMQVIIKDASVIATQLPKPQGVNGFFTDSQDKRYDAKLSVEIRIYGEGAMSEANVTASVTRSITINQKASVAERTAIFRRLVYDMMDAMNAQLEQNMFMYFGKYISYSHTP